MGGRVSMRGRFELLQTQPGLKVRLRLIRARRVEYMPSVGCGPVRIILYESGAAGAPPTDLVEMAEADFYGALGDVMREALPTRGGSLLS